MLEIFLATVEAFGLAVKGIGTLFRSALGPLDFLPSASLFLLPRLAEAKSLFPPRELAGFTDVFSFVFSPLENAGGLVLPLFPFQRLLCLRSVPRDHESDQRTQDESHRRRHD